MSVLAQLAVHPVLRLIEVDFKDEVFYYTLEAKPGFIDSDRTSWNMNPELLREALDCCARRGALPKAVFWCIFVVKAPISL